MTSRCCSDLCEASMSQLHKLVLVTTRAKLLLNSVDTGACWRVLARAGHTNQLHKNAQLVRNSEGGNNNQAPHFHARSLQALVKRSRSSPAAVVASLTASLRSGLAMAISVQVLLSSETWLAVSRTCIASSALPQTAPVLSCGPKQRMPDQMRAIAICTFEQLWCVQFMYVVAPFIYRRLVFPCSALFARTYCILN